eukprot:SAG31_NODE_10214_length_1169_cov_2.114019_2_plen_87_part_00
MAMPLSSALTGRVGSVANSGSSSSSCRGNGGGASGSVDLAETISTDGSVIVGEIHRVMAMPLVSALTSRVGSVVNLHVGTRCNTDR